MLLALDLKQAASKKAVDLAREKGLLINGPRPDTLRFMPALTITEDEVDQMIDIMKEVLKEALEEA